MTASPSLSFTFRQSAAGPFDELDRIRLTAPFSSKWGLIPKGSVGTVVAVWQHGAAYEVEFAEPFHTVETVSVETLERTSGRG